MLQCQILESHFWTDPLDINWTISQVQCNFGFNFYNNANQ